ncbi:MAG: hypothetical protein ACE361_17410 [Aureliella sp.]
MPREFDEFAATAHNAKLSPEDLIRLENLVYSQRRIGVAYAKRKSKKLGLSFCDPAYDELQRLRDVLRYNKSAIPSVEGRSHIDARNAVKRTYSFGDELLRAIISLGDMSQNLPLDTAFQDWGELEGRRADNAEDLLEQVKLAGNDLHWTFESIKEAVMDLLPGRLTKEEWTVTDSKGQSGFTAIYLLDLHWKYQVEHWVKKLISSIRTGRAFTEAFPILDADQSEIFRRLRVEKSVMINALPGYLGAPTQSKQVSANNLVFLYASTHSNPDFRDLAAEINTAALDPNDTRSQNRIATDFFDDPAEAKRALAALRMHEKRSKKLNEMS